MGRRALRRTDPTLDLSKHLLTPEQLPATWDAAALFGRTAPLEVEMGSGKGLFLSTEPLARPEHDFLGVEVSGKYARFTAARLTKRRIANARMIHGDGLQLFAQHLPDAAVAAVHVYFPDPWWKACHKKRRVMNPAFVRDVERVLVAGGRLHFWTDVREYFDTTLTLLAAETTLDGPHAVAERVAEHDLDYRTHFERRTRLTAQAVHRAEFIKPGGV